MNNHHLLESQIIITSGSNYMDIDAYACCIAMAELLQLKNQNAIAYSNAPCNYSVCESFVEEHTVLRTLPEDIDKEKARYVIVDVSDPAYLNESVPLEQVVAVYDHHVGFEDYWANRIGSDAHIEFIGAAATLIYREWIQAGLQEQMKWVTARLLVAAILDNTLNLTSSNTTQEDLAAYHDLCRIGGVDRGWCDVYFDEVQRSIEADLKNALFGDVKHISNNAILPSYMGQIVVWNAECILCRLPEIRLWFAERYGEWMLNMIDIQRCCNYFVCDSPEHQKKIEKLFGVRFESGIAKTPVSYLRKEIIKKTLDQ